MKQGDAFCFLEISVKRFHIPVILPSIIKDSGKVPIPLDLYKRSIAFAEFILRADPIFSGKLRSNED
jgi:hypothetical protein